MRLQASRARNQATIHLGKPRTDMVKVSMEEVSTEDRLLTLVADDHQGFFATIVLAGDWRDDENTIALLRVQRAEFMSKLRELPEQASISFDCSDLGAWKGSLLALILAIREAANRYQFTIDFSELPEGLRNLLNLATAVPERGKAAESDEEEKPFVEAIGEFTLEHSKDVAEVLRFIGDLTLAFGRLVVGRPRFRRADLIKIAHSCGAKALPIVTLISLLVGLILAFVGAIQLRMFGAEIYVADLVGIGMVRELAAIMTGVVMAGRTGAAFAAELGSMQVNEEIDALKTMGIPPIDFLVLPRFLALVAMMPLLSLYANIMAITGGMIVGVSVLGIEAPLYYNQTVNAIGIKDFWVGLVLAVTFGVIVSICGCLRGMQCGRSSIEVGRVTTSAVVTSIIWIIIATAIITVICDIIGV